MENSRTVESTITAAVNGNTPVRVETAGHKVDRTMVLWTAILVLGTFVAGSVVLALNIPAPREGPFNEPLDRILIYVQLGTIVVPTLIAFFGFYLAREEMRDAIAGSFLISFILILAESLILSLGLFGTEPGSVREIFITNYLNLTGTIALFYFGSEAVIKIATQLAAGRVGSATAQLPATTAADAAGRPTSRPSTTPNTDLPSTPA